MKEPTWSVLSFWVGNTHVTSLTTRCSNWYYNADKNTLRLNGSCNVYAIAHNGVYKRIKVKVTA